jgi:Cu/Ag efflux protein CusF
VQFLKVFSMSFKPLSVVVATFFFAVIPFFCTTVQAAAAVTDGEVKKVDTKAQTITLAHGPIKNLDMPPMTMVFKVKSPALLAGVKVGDKVKFSAEMPNGVMTVVALEASR